MQVFTLMSQDVDLARKMQFKMLVVFLPIFVADAKIIFRYDFVAPLTLGLVSKFKFSRLKVP